MVNRQQLAAVAKLTTSEIPGLAYTNDTSYVISYALEVPIVDHYLQQPNCSFVQVNSINLTIYIDKLKLIKSKRT
jgi:hypothetical protein